MEEDVSGNWIEDMRFEFLDGWGRWASFAAIWLWCCLMNRIPAIEISTIGNLSWLTSNTPAALGVVVALIPVVILSDRIATVVGSRNFILFGTISISLGTALMFVGHMLGTIVLAFIGGLLGGVAIGLFKIAWGEMYSRMPLRRGLISMGFSLVISIALFIVISLCPGYVAWTVLALCAVSCGALIRLGVGQLQRGGEGAQEGEPSAKKVKRSWTFLVLPVLVALTSGIMTESAAVVDTVATGSLLEPISLSFSELLTGLFLIVSARFLSRRYGAAQIYAMGLLFSVAGYLIHLFDLAPLWMSTAVTNFGFSIFYFFMIVFWGNLAARMGYSVVKVYAMGYLVFMGSMCIGQALELFLMVFDASGYAVYIAVSLVLVFFMATLFLYGDSRSPVHIWLTGDEPVETDDRVSEACMRMSRDGKLTPREYEVLIMLARGRTASYISHSLGISYDTAKTHIKNIYNKLDVHNQQDLMDDVEALSGKPV